MIYFQSFLMSNYFLLLKEYVQHWHFYQPFKRDLPTYQTKAIKVIQNIFYMMKT